VLGFTTGGATALLHVGHRCDRTLDVAGRRHRASRSAPHEVLKLWPKAGAENVGKGLRKCAKQ
jgi:hypothetical protein